MNENDTFSVLKGISREEAEAIYQKIWIESCADLDAEGIDITGGIPIHVLRERCDLQLKRYGWSYDKLFPWNIGSFS